MKTTAILIALCALLSCRTQRPDNRAADLHGKRVLVFTGHGDGYVHENIPASAQMMLRMAADEGFTADTTSRMEVFCDDSLGRYDAIVYANASYLKPDSAQKAALQRFIRNGKGFVGLHAATCAGKEWEWFTRMIGGMFDYHPPLQPLTLKVVDGTHPSTAGMPDSVEVSDELYVFRRLNPDARVIAVWETAGVDWNGRRPDALLRSLPAIWCLEFEGGRVWYTALGHDPADYSRADYRAQVLGGLKWAVAGPAEKN